MVFTICLVFIPISAALKYLVGASPLLVFASSALAIAVLAEWVRRATDQLADRVGPAIGGLLSVSFGSIAELVLALFVLMRGEAAVVQAQITGSIMGTRRFSPERAGLLSTLLILVVIALLLPAVFDLSGRMSGQRMTLGITDEELSLSVSVVLLLLYLANLAFTLVTHRDVFAKDKDGAEADWSLPFALAVLVGATAAIAFESEMLSGTVTKAAGTLHLSPMFLGVIVLALVGTAGDLFAASWFAHEDRMGLVFSICIGSAVQMALVLAPLLVIISWALGRPMTLVFSNPLHLFAIASTALIVNAVARDGETTWFEGLLLVGVYVLFGLAFFFTGPA
jgi:Ca2+:H+ antiporter